MKNWLHYFHPLEKLKRKQKQFLHNNSVPSLPRRLVRYPSVSIDTPTTQCNYIVLDFETSGFDVEEDNILSVGWVELKSGKVDLSTATHAYINSESSIKPETAVINHITPQMLLEGVSIDDALSAFMIAAMGKVIVAHGCIMEKQFLDNYFVSRYHMAGVPIIWLDTLCLEKRLAKGINQHMDIDLRLASTRERYGLPAYNSHNALSDAVATAELLLAQEKRLSSGRTLPFGTLFRLSQ